MQNQFHPVVHTYSVGDLIGIFIWVKLRGRSGRQGDPGSSRFFLSLEDNIFRIFGGDRIQASNPVLSLSLYIYIFFFLLF